MTSGSTRALIEGNPVLVVIDIQGGANSGDEPSEGTAIPFMEGYDERLSLIHI